MCPTDTTPPLPCSPPRPAVQSCDPPLAAMPALVAELNGGGSFSRFVRCVRREFQALAAAEAAQRGAGGGAAPQPVAAC